MPDAFFPQLLEQFREGGPDAIFDRLATSLRERREYHRLFDALCLKKKFELGAPLHRPTAFDDIAIDKRDEFEAAYVAAAREVGQLLLNEQKLSEAFVYYHALRETSPLRDAIEAMPVYNDSCQESEELIDLAFYKLVHPVKGMQIMLKTHGTCSTITALDQAFPNLNPEQRSACAALLVSTLHNDLMNSVRRDVLQRMPIAESSGSLREMIRGRDWLFADNNYHVDVSHLHSAVRFARSLSPGQPELALARELSEYGSQLGPPYQYAGEPPFSEYYPAHIQFFKFLMKEDRDQALTYFQKQLENEGEAADQAMIAYVIVDLLARTEQIDAAIPFAEKYLVKTDSNFISAFSELCGQAGRFDVLMRSAEERNDPISYVAALVQQ